MNTISYLKRPRLFRKISLSLMALVSISGLLTTQLASAATPTFKQSKAVEVGSGKTAATAFASATTAGDLIAVQVLWSNTAAVTITDSRGNTYTAATARTTWGNNWSTQVFYAKNIIGGTTTVTATFATSLTSFGIVQSHEYAGIDKTSPLDGTVSAIGATATAASGNLTVTGANDLLFSAGDAEGALGNPPTGWTARLNTSGNRTADKVATSAGTYSISASASGKWAMQLVAFKADNGVADTTAPSAPASLTATPAASGTQIDLSWAAASDNVGVTGYRLERCQGASCSTFAQIATPSATTYSDTALTPATSYSYRVRATDAAGNLGAYSPVATATTPSVVDTTAPSTPANLTATPASSTQVNLSWTAATDNVGVTGYRVYRGGVQVGTPTATAFSDTGLTAGATYSYTVSAIDAAGNESAQTAAVQATTPVPDTTAPVVAISAPADAATVSGNVTVSADATDTGSGVHDVQFYLEGTPTTDVTTAPYSYQWNTATSANGTYHLTAVAKDNAGNLSATSATVTVTVNNQVSAAPLKIMALGDSLTQGGVNSNLPGQFESTTINGYRLNLLNLLTPLGYTIDYVGSWQLGNSQLADQDENGFSGACIMVSPCGGGTLYPQTAGWITSENPDLVIMQGGENDFSSGGMTEQQDATNMESWIQLVWSTKPSAKIIVTGAPWHDTYDSLVHTYVDNLQAQGKAIRWVPYGSNIGRIDGTHPNAAGYTTWANELAPMVQQLFPR